MDLVMSEVFKSAAAEPSTHAPDSRDQAPGALHDQAPGAGHDAASDAAPGPACNPARDDASTGARAARAREIIAAQLAKKRAGAVSQPRFAARAEGSAKAHNQNAPAPIRPGGRGRRG